MYFVFIAYIPCVLALLLIGFLTLLKNHRSLLNVSFFLLSVCISLWLLALFVGDLTINLTTSLWAIRIASMLGTLLAPLLILFSISFPLKIGKTPKFIYYLSITPTVFFSIISLTPLLIPGVEFVNHTAQPSGVGLLYTLQSLYIVSCWVLGLYMILKKFRKVGPREKSQIKIVIFGLAVALTVNVGTGYILTSLGVANNYSNLLGSFSILTFVATSAYAIIKYRLFDIRLAIVRFIGYSLTVAIVSTFYSIAVIVIGARLTDLTSASYRPLLIVLVITTILVSLTFHRLQKLVNRLTMKVFYQNAYGTRSVLEDLSDKLLQENTIDGIMSGSLSVLTSAIRPFGSTFITFSDEGGIYKMAGTTKHDSEIVREIVSSVHSKRSLVIEKDQVKDHRLKELFAASDVEVMLRLGSSAKPTGVLLFGAKKDGRMYSTQDIDLLRIGAKNMTIAIDNARKYEQISHFADTLKDEVEHATLRLRHANDKLKTLDHLKDDFISMASHQFRTPAGSIRQAFNMMHSMKLSKKDREEVMLLAEANSEQLVSVVNTMLNISRIEADRFAIDRSLTDISSLVDKVIQATSIVANQKAVKLEYSRPDHNIMLEVDRAKINEAMKNYIENAIKYSPENSTVKIALHEEGRNINFDVSDCGMGVPEGERHGLFGKFYRAQNARKHQPDGNGIGLYVVKKIAEGHGGDVYYEPLETGGSMFGFTIPLDHNHEHAAKG